MRLILLNKPFQVLPQFTSPDGRRCLADLLQVPGAYPAGRLDYDSEGLMVLTDFGPWQARISQPGSPFPKTYLAQVEGEPGEAALHQLRTGVDAQGRAHAAGPGRGGAGTGLVVAARSADSVPPPDPDRLDRTDVDGRPQPAGAPHDRGRRPADAAPAADRPSGPGGSRGWPRASGAKLPRAEAEAVLGADRLRRTVRTPRSASRVRGPARN